MQAVILETATMPSRIQGAARREGSMGHTASLFADLRNRSIIRAECSIKTPLGDSRNRSDRENRPLRDKPALDMDMLPSTGPTPRNGRRRQQTFTRLDVLRGRRYLVEGEGVRYNDESDPVVKEFVLDTTFPRLTSFPEIFGSQDSFDIETSLVADSEVAELLRSYSHRSRQLLSGDDREEVSNGLETWAEEYVEGFEDDSDDGGEDEQWQ
jgi:hypothetical protein